MYHLKGYLLYLIYVSRTIQNNGEIWNCLCNDQTSRDFCSTSVLYFWFLQARIKESFAPTNTPQLLSYHDVRNAVIQCVVQWPMRLRTARYKVLAQWCMGKAFLAACGSVVNDIVGHTRHFLLDFLDHWVEVKKWHNDEMKSKVCQWM